MTLTLVTEQETKGKTLEIRDLHVTVGGKPILKGISLTIKPGEVHALMGPNGSGKSTLSHVIAGHPAYKVEKGDILLDGTSVLRLSPDERAKAGLFLAFQNPLEIPGLNLGTYLFMLWKQRNPDKRAVQFHQELGKLLSATGIPQGFTERPLNVGLSGGERKRMEVLQMLLLQPSLAVLDETDSGLDIDSLQKVAAAVNTLRSSAFGALVITHYDRVLQYLKPDKVHVILDGKIAMSGDASLPATLEQTGYSWLHEEDARA